MFSTRRNAVAVAPNPWKVPTNTDARESVKRRPSRGGFLFGVLSSAALVATFIAIGSSASAASSNWKLSDGSVNTPASAVAAFDFVKPDSAHLLYSSTFGASKYGTDDSTGSMSATFTVDNVTGTFTYGSAITGCTGGQATVGLFFESITPGSKFAYTNYWWSNPERVALGPNGVLTPLAPVLMSDPAQWSDWNGHSGTFDGQTTAAFIAATKSVTAVGLSFGGGCFFENGVGTTDGSGSFTLNSFGA
jgi:hypothetical protein